MAEFQKVLEEKKRMCERTMCNKCPLGTFVTDVTTCNEWMLRHPKGAEDRIMQWAAEHPIMTNGIKFREVFGQPYEHLFEANGFIKQWLSQEYEGGQDEN